MVDPVRPSAVLVQAEARKWVGTPVRFKGRTCGVSVDCIGLILGVGFAAGGLVVPPDELEHLERYGWLPNSVVLQDAMSRFMVPAFGDWRPGDVGAFDWGARDLPMHLAIMADYGGRMTMIHANPLSKPKRVTEGAYGGCWPERLCGFWRYPGLA
jgi:cell wall-associated NlpC family hydrolase